jgi:hypothetical protein
MWYYELYDEQYNEKSQPTNATSRIRHLHIESGPQTDPSL